MMTRLPNNHGLRVVDLDAAVEAEAGAMPKQRQENPEDEGAVTHKRWQHIRHLAWNAYFQRTRADGELAPDDESWRGRGATVRPRREDDEAEDAADVLEQLDFEPEDDDAGDELGAYEENDEMSDQKEKVRAAYVALANQIGFKPSPRFVAERAGITGEYARGQVATILAEWNASGAELPFFDQKLTRGAEKATAEALAGKAPSSSTAAAVRSPKRASQPAPKAEPKARFQKEIADKIQPSTASDFRAAALKRREALHAEIELIDRLLELGA